MNRLRRRLVRPSSKVAAALLAALAAGAGCGIVDGPSRSSLDAAGMEAVEADEGGAVDGGGDGGSDVDGDPSGGTLAISTETAAVRPVVEIPSEWPSVVEEVYGRYWLYWEAFAAAHGPPEADPTYEPLRELSSEANWVSLEEQLGSFAADGLVLDLPERSITEHLLRIPNASVLTGDEGDEVVLQDCWIDDFVQRTLDGEVVGEAHEAKLMNVVMKVIDGEWRVHGVSRAAPESDGYQQCVELIDQE